MKVRTPDGEVHDLPAPDAVRLMHTSGAVPVVDQPKTEKRPAVQPAAEKRATKSGKG